MNQLKIGVVDYGMGNLHSVVKALALQGGHVFLSSDKSALRSSDILVVPGVGSFGAAMRNLGRNGLDDFIRYWIEESKPYLGICLGLQLLFEESEEDPGVPGLSALKGAVVKFQKRDFKKTPFIIPHMGWNTAERRHPEKGVILNGAKDLNLKKRGDSSPSAQNDILKAISPADSFYFVHTYFPAPKQRDVILTTTTYGKPFCSSVSTKNIFASQFHPEKSGTVGLKLLSNVIRKFSEN